MTRKTWIAGIVLALVAGFVGSFASLSYANDQFPDSITGTFFHDPVSAIKTAGCAGGFGDGTFRENDAVTRGQFTLWFQNCLPRVARTRSNSPITFPAAGPTPTVLLTDTITVGGFAGETQFVRITGVVDVSPTDSTYSCSGSAVACPIEVSIFVGGSSVQTQTVFEVNGTGFAGAHRENVTVEAVVSVTTGDTISYSMRGSGLAGTGGNTAEARSLVAQTVPFGPTGTNVGP